MGRASLPAAGPIWAPVRAPSPSSLGISSTTSDLVPLRPATSRAWPWRQPGICAGHGSIPRATVSYISGYARIAGSMGAPARTARILLRRTPAEWSPRAPDQDQRVVLPGAPEAQGVHSHHLHMRRRCRILGQPPPARNPWRRQAKAPRSTTHTSYTTPPTFTIQMCTFPGVLPGWPQQARGRGESDLLARPNLPVEGSNTQNTHAHTRRNSSS